MGHATHTNRLATIALARSGDKGRGANIGVIAQSREAYVWIGEHLTTTRVAEFFAPLRPGNVSRYALPNLLAYNFLLPEILDGGGSRTLRTDAQGKALGQVLLEMELDIPQSVLDSVAEAKEH